MLIKGKIDKHISSKNFGLQKTLVRRQKEKLKTGTKGLRTTCLTKDYYLEYINNFLNQQ